MTELEPTIEALLSEHRVFEPSADFRNRALWNDPGIYERAAADPEAFWAEQAERFVVERWHQVMEWNPPWVKWFTGGTLNVSYNCLDRHVEAGGGRQGRLLLGGRARRRADHHVPRPVRGDLPVRERA